MTDFTPAFAILEPLNPTSTMATSDFIAAVRPSWEEQFPCIEHLVTTPESGLGGTYDDLNEFNAAQGELMEFIGTLPRGAWGTITQRMPTNDHFIDALISDGAGGVSLRSYTHEPTYAEVSERMVWDEIYSARQKFCTYVKAREVKGILDANGWRVGTVLDQALIDGGYYTNVTIREVLTDVIVVEGTTRSGRARHTYRCNPRDIEIPATKAAA